MRDSRPTDSVITGAGVVTGLGYGLETCYEQLAAGASAIQPTADAAEGAALGVAALIEPPYLRTEVPREMMAEIKFLNDAGELAVEATIEAVAQAALPESVAPEMRGLYLSQMDGGDWSCMELRPAVVAATEQLEKPLVGSAMNEAAHRGRKIKPHFMLESLKNNAFSFLATMFGLRGANTSVAGYAGATQQAIDMGVRALARGGMDAAIICGAARPTSAVARTEMEALQLTTPPGDGAATIVMERRADVEARGATALAAVMGLGNSTHQPAEGSWAPPTEAFVEAARQALASADVDSEDLGAVVTPALREAESEALLSSLRLAPGVRRLSWQPQTGQLALATETVELALASRLVAEIEGPILLLSAGLLGQAGALVLSRA